mmetsp:Transcript_40419/g.112365  ORF Transcript_40419/g.112365 Transcript_40419/m.112365 type:complete len:263 (+) Transcript_40419:138-926(+)
MCASALSCWKAARTSANRRKERRSRTGPSGQGALFPSMTREREGNVEATLTSSASAASFSQTRSAAAMLGARSLPASTCTNCAPTARIFSMTVLSRCRLTGNSIWYSGSGKAGSAMDSASASGMTLTGTSCSTRWSATFPARLNSKPRMGLPSRPLARRSVVLSLEAQLWKTCTRFAIGASRSILFCRFDSMRYSWKSLALGRWPQVCEPSSAPPLWQMATASLDNFSTTLGGSPPRAPDDPFRSAARSRRCSALRMCMTIA